MAPSNSTQPSTRALHADDYLNLVTDVAPPIHLSTTFRYPKQPENLALSEDPVEEFDGTNYVYSREFAPNATRFEAVLSSLLDGYVVSYSTGLAALHAALVLVNPRRVSVGEGYHGSHEVIAVISRLSGLQKLPLDCPAESLGEGDVILLETPVNPLIIDSTFAPPPLQHPFLWGADIILHSGSKYFGGHRDLLCGVLATKRKDWQKMLMEDRLALGNVMGNMESWLGLRSLRTLDIRVQRTSESSGKLIAWLHKARESPSPGSDSDEQLVQAVQKDMYHASLQTEPWLREQMPNGFGPVFSITLQNEDYARKLPSKLALFQHATSLGGVESLIEWGSLSDARVDRKLLRVSVGLEDWEDLKNDLLGGFKSLVEEKNN